jgi:hypothetical protein
LLLTTGYQESLSSSIIEIDSALTPSMPSLRAAALRASSVGLAVALKPHVDVRNGARRGSIDPDDPERWFDSYRNVILPLADFAESVGAMHFVVGTELGGILRHEEQWTRTISLVRSRFSGTIIYAASWDEASVVPFWNDVDIVGIDAYFPVAHRTQAGRFELLAGWQVWLNRLEQLHRKTGKPIVCTEIGYRSLDGAGMAPYDFKIAGSADINEQADLYWAALEALGSADWIAGLYWWNVRPGGPLDRLNTDYTPLGKPAEEELRLSWDP